MTPPTTITLRVPSYTAIKLPPGWVLLSNTATADGWRELVYGWEA